MKWSTYYDKFYDWSESTQINRISQLTEFSSKDELIEIMENFFSQKGSSLLIDRALSQGFYFSVNDVINICEYLDKSTVKSLIKQCNEKFAKHQIEHIIDNTMMFEDELILALNYLSLYPMSDDDNLTWCEFFENFYNLNLSQQVLALQKINNFGDEFEICEIASYLSDKEAMYNFIKKALNKKVKFSYENIDFLISHNKNIRNLFKHQRINAPKEKKIGFWSSVGLGLLGVDIISHIFKEKEK